VPTPKQYPLFKFMESRRRIPKQGRSKPCGFYNPGPKPIPEKFWKLRPTALTEEEAQWLKECGVAWDQKPGVQLSLNFCDHQESVRET
jgi:hypothetical protein